MFFSLSPSYKKRGCKKNIGEKGNICKITSANNIIYFNKIPNKYKKNEFSNKSEPKIHQSGKFEIESGKKIREKITFGIIY